MDGVGFTVEAGEIVGLLGRNGAGKTTSFRMTIGMLTPEQGKVMFDGRDVTFEPMFKHAKAGMGYLSQEPSVFQKLTVEQNVMAILETRGLDREARNRRCEELLEQFGLQHKRKEQARTCSGGERRRLEIARSLVTRPRLMLLDEPFAAVDPHTVEELQAEVRKLADEGIAMLVTDHNVQQTMRICDRAYIIHEGKNLRDGDPRTIINDPGGEGRVPRQHLPRRRVRLSRRTLEDAKRIGAAGALRAQPLPRVATSLSRSSILRRKTSKPKFSFTNLAASSARSMTAASPLRS